MFFYEAISQFSQYDTLTPILFSHPVSNELLQCSVCGIQGYRTRQTKIVIQRTQSNDDTLTIGQFFEIADSLRAEQEDHEILVDFAEDHDYKDDVYYHVDALYYQPDNGGYFVFTLCEPDSARDFKSSRRFNAESHPMKVNEILMIFDEYPDAIPILVNHPDSKEFLQFSYCYSVAFENDNTVASTSQVEPGNNAFSIGTFRAMTRDYRSDQLDDYFVIDLEDDHALEYDWYYHVIDVEVQTGDSSQCIMVLYLGAPEAATSYVARQLPQEENNTNDDYDPFSDSSNDYDPFSDSSSSDYNPFATNSSSSPKTSKPASTIRPAKPIDIAPNVGFGIDVASGTPSIGFKFGGGSRVGLGYNIAAKKVGMQLWV